MCERIGLKHYEAEEKGVLRIRDVTPLEGTICERKRTFYGTHSPESISLVSIERAGLSNPFNSCRLEGSDDVADVADDGCDGLLMEGPKNIKIR